MTWTLAPFMLATQTSPAILFVTGNAPENRKAIKKETTNHDCGFKALEIFRILPIVETVLLPHIFYLLGK
jgi:hypothetical protein